MTEIMSRKIVGGLPKKKIQLNHSKKEGQARHSVVIALNGSSHMLGKTFVM